MWVCKAFILKRICASISLFEKPPAKVGGVAVFLILVIVLQDFCIPVRLSWQADSVSLDDWLKEVIGRCGSAHGLNCCQTSITARFSFSLANLIFSLYREYCPRKPCKSLPWHWEKHNESSRRLMTWKQVSQGFLERPPQVLPSRASHLMPRDIFS